MMGYESIKLVFQAEHLLIATLALIFSGVFTFLSYRITNPPTGRFRKGILISPRLIAFFCLFFSLFQPLLLGRKTETIQPKLVALIDNSRSVAFNREPAELKARIDQILESKELKYTTENYLFADTLEQSDDLDNLDNLDFTKNASAIGDALVEIQQRFDPITIGGILLLSDGQTNLGESPERAAANSPAPIYTIGLGNPEAPVDISVERVVHNKVAYSGTAFPIEVTLKSWGPEEITVPVFLASEGKVLDSRKTTLKGDGEYISLDFEITPTEEGVQTYSVYLSHQENEFLTGNNSRYFSVKVLPGKQEVLLVVGSLSWEHTFFKRILASKENLKLSTFFIRDTHLGELHRFPETAEQLRKYNSVILFDALDYINSSKYSEPLISYLKEGGSVLFLIEGHHLPTQVSSFLNQLLPYEIATGKGRQVRDRFVPDLTVEGEKHPITNLSEGGITLSNTEIYSSRPPLESFTMVGDLRPGAKALLVHPKLRDIPILTAYALDAGKILAFNGTPLWRWGFQESGPSSSADYYRILVTNMVQWLLAPMDLTPFQVSTDRRVYKGGEPIFINANLIDEKGEPVVGANIRVKLEKVEDDTTFKPITFSLEEMQKGVYSYKVQTLSKGKYRITATATLEDITLGTKVTSFMVEEYSLEYKNLQRDEANLKAIASYSGGKYAPVEEAEDLLGSIDIKAREITYEQEKNLWELPILLIVFILALASEWTIRRRSDLL